MPRRTLAVLAASATLGTAAITPIAIAQTTPPAPAPVQQRDAITDLLGLLSTLPVQTVLGLFPALNNAAGIGSLLSAANPAQLATLLAGLTPAQLSGALGTLNPTQLFGVLSGSPAGSLAGLFAMLSPSQIAGLGPLSGGAHLLVTGLQAIIATNPAAPQIDALLAQLTAALPTIPGADFSQLDPLLTAVAPLLSVAGVSPAQLTALLTVLKTSPSTAGVAALLNILDPTAGGTVTPTPTATGGTTPTPTGSSTPTPGTGTVTPTPTVRPGTSPTPTATSVGTGVPTPTATAVSTNFRASVSKVKVTKKGKKASVRVSCPATAPGCFVGITGKVGANKAFKKTYATLTPGAVQTVKLKIAGKAAKALRKHGKLRVTVATAGSSLGAASAKGKLKR